MTKTTKPAEHGGEFARYLDPSGWLIAFCENGAVLGKSIVHREWRVLRRKKPEIPAADWKQRKLDRLAELPWWRKQVRCLPSMRQLEEWSYDGVCESIGGEDVEPDGTDSRGTPSWLIALGLV